MIPSSFHPSAAPYECAVACALVVLCAVALAQSSPTQDAKSLVARIDEARGTPARPVTSLAIEGTFVVGLEGVNDGKPVVEGKFREVFSGEKLARHTSDMGEHGLMEKGTTEDLVWDLDPMTGAKIHGEAGSVNERRYFALLRGASPSDLYREFAVAGTQALDGREHVVVKMTPPAGKPDTWYVDAKTGLVGRVDIGISVPEGADLVWGVGAEVEAQLTFGEWKRIDGVQYPHRRTLKLGAAVFEFTCSKVEPNAKLEAARFAPPEAVIKAKGKPHVSVPNVDSRPGYQIVEREAQAVASIRMKVRAADLTETLTVIYPEVISHLYAAGAKIAGPPYSRYHSVSGEEIDLEAGLPIAKAVEEKGRVKMGELPGGRTVIGWHIGPYEKLTAAHAALRAHVDAQKLKPRGGAWEVYWTDPGVVPDPAKWRTQLFMAIEK